MISVYQNKNFLDYRRNTVPLSTDMVKVAEVATFDLNTAYGLTNTIENYWWENAGVTPLFSGDGCRSTSVGDVMQLGDEFYLVAFIGFEKLEGYSI